MFFDMIMNFIISLVPNMPVCMPGTSTVLHELEKLSRKSHLQIAYKYRNLQNYISANEWWVLDQIFSQFGSLTICLNWEEDAVSLKLLDFGQISPSLMVCHVVGRMGI
jgi:hypothetical protein